VAAETCGGDCFPTGVLESMLVGVDDHVIGVLLSLQRESLPDREGRTAIRKTDLDHHPRPLCDKKVAQNITIWFRERHALEIAVGPDLCRADLSQPPAH